MTEPGGPAWRQTTFHPFSVTARLAKGGTVLEPKLSAGTVDTPRYGEVDGVNAVAVRCADGSLAVFAVNRSLRGDRRVRDQAARTARSRHPSRRRRCTTTICSPRIRSTTRTV